MPEKMSEKTPEKMPPFIQALLLSVQENLRKDKFLVPYAMVMTASGDKVVPVILTDAFKTAVEAAVFPKAFGAWLKSIKAYRAVVIRELMEWESDSRGYVIMDMSMSAIAVMGREFDQVGDTIVFKNWVSKDVLDELVEEAKPIRSGFEGVTVQ